MLFRSTGRIVRPSNLIQFPQSNSLSGTISVSGAFALYPMMTVWAEEFTKIHPDVQFDVQGGGAGKGMTDTIAGAVDIGMISRSIKDEETAQGIFWVSVTKDAVFPIISTENPVADQILAKGISQEIFNKIYITGEITTWGEVDRRPVHHGNDQRFHPFRRGWRCRTMGEVCRRRSPGRFVGHRCER